MQTIYLNDPIPGCVRHLLIVFAYNNIFFSSAMSSVCACGKWVCTSSKCPEKHQQDLTNIEDILETEEDSEEYYDEEEEGEDPEDDPDVQDISWF